MNKLYILTGSKGTWDDYIRVNIGVYDSEELAKEAGERFLEKRKSMLDAVRKNCPITPEQLKIVEETFETDNLTESEASQYYSWLDFKYALEEINNEYFVETLELNVDSFHEIMNFDIDEEWL